MLKWNVNTEDNKSYERRIWRPSGQHVISIIWIPNVYPRQIGQLSIILFIIFLKHKIQLLLISGFVQVGTKNNVTIDLNRCLDR